MFDMEFLNQLAELAPLLSFITVSVGVIFGIMQIRQFKQQRNYMAAVEVMRTMQTRDFTDSLKIVNKLDSGLTREDIQNNHGDAELSILALTTKFETLGYLVYRKVIPIEFVEQLVGGVSISLWDKLNQYVLDFREEEENPILLEWFEWLAFQFRQRNRHKSQSAIQKFRNWKP